MIEGHVTWKNAGSLLMMALFVGVIGTLWTSSVGLLVVTVAVFVVATYLMMKPKVTIALIAFVGLVVLVQVGSGINGLFAVAVLGAFVTLISNVNAYRSGVHKW